MNLGKVIAFFICAFGLWVGHFREGILNNIESILILNLALIIASTEKIIDAIKAKESTVVVGEIKSVSEIKEVK